MNITLNILFLIYLYQDSLLLLSKSELMVRMSLPFASRKCIKRLTVCQFWAKGDWWFLCCYPSKT